VDKWTFSTNGVAIMGMFGIPCIGFGPGKESEAHAPNEKTWKADLVRCAAFYAALPQIYVEGVHYAEAVSKTSNTFHHLAYQRRIRNVSWTENLP